MFDLVVTGPKQILDRSGKMEAALISAQLKPDYTAIQKRWGDSRTRSG
jgi:hypothetical protein